MNNGATTVHQIFVDLVKHAAMHRDCLTPCRTGPAAILHATMLEESCIPTVDYEMLDALSEFMEYCYQDGEQGIPLPRWVRYRPGCERARPVLN